MPTPTKPIMTPAQANAMRELAAAKQKLMDKDPTPDMAPIVPGAFDTVLAITFLDTRTNKIHTWVCADDAAYYHAMNKIEASPVSKLMNNGACLVKR